MELNTCFWNSTDRAPRRLLRPFYAYWSFPDTCLPSSASYNDRYHHGHHGGHPDKVLEIHCNFAPVDLIMRVICTTMAPNVAADLVIMLDNSDELWFSLGRCIRNIDLRFCLF